MTKVLNSSEEKLDAEIKAFFELFPTIHVQNASEFLETINLLKLLTKLVDRLIPIRSYLGLIQKLQLEMIQRRLIITELSKARQNDGDVTELMSLNTDDLISLLAKETTANLNHIMVNAQKMTCTPASIVAACAILKLPVYKKITWLTGRDKNKDKDPVNMASIETMQNIISDLYKSEHILSSSILNSVSRGYNYLVNVYNMFMLIKPIDKWLDEQMLLKRTVRLAEIRRVFNLSTHALDKILMIAEKEGYQWKKKTGIKIKPDKITITNTSVVSYLQKTAAQYNMSVEKYIIKISRANERQKQRSLLLQDASKKIK